MKKGKDIPVIIGTRGSELALWQARFTQSELLKQGIICELKIIQTSGDATQAWNLSFDKLEGKGFFTKELEEALLKREIDLAVHSCKDLPTENPAGLIIAAYSQRADPFDVLLIRPEKAEPQRLLRLSASAIVGTSSARRKAQLLAFRPDLEIRDLRGNVPTRIRKLKEGQYDAILLAKAGLDRLNISLGGLEVVELRAPMFIPAPAQGVLAFQVRNDDSEMLAICEYLNDPGSSIITHIERSLLRDFEGGCQMPLGIYSEMKEGKVYTWISQAAAWNTFPKRVHLVFSPESFNSHTIVEQFRKSLPKTVFISSDLEADDYLARGLREHGYTFHAESLLDFTPVDFIFDGKADWLFFSSRNAIRFFFDRVGKDRLTGIKFAAVGESTAQALRERGVPVYFTGNGVGATSASAFEKVAEGRVVFPMAAHSLRAVQENIKRSVLQLSDLVVYQNIPKAPVSKREEQVLVFTSPMNARAYFGQQTFDPGQHVIANGPSTAKMLEELNISHQISYAPYPWSLLDRIFSA